MSEQEVNYTPAPSKLWIKDSAGFPSVSITFLFVSFWVTTFAYVLSMISKIGPFEIRAFDPASSAAYFGIVFSAYIARRATDAKWGNPQIPGSVAAVRASVTPSQGPQAK